MSEINAHLGDLPDHRMERERSTFAIGLRFRSSRRTIARVERELKLGSDLVRADCVSNGTVPRDTLAMDS